MWRGWKWRMREKFQMQELRSVRSSSAPSHIKKDTVHFVQILNGNKCVRLEYLIVPISRQRKVNANNFSSRKDIIQDRPNDSPNIHLQCSEQQGGDEPVWNV